MKLLARVARFLHWEFNRAIEFVRMPADVRKTLARAYELAREEPLPCPWCGARFLEGWRWRWHATACEHEPRERRTPPCPP